MQRASVFADLRLGEHWRGFAQLSRSTTNGRIAGPSPVDENRLDPTNLFVEWQPGGDGEGRIGMRVGIQELQFGSGRMIDVRSTRAGIISATKRPSGHATSSISTQR